MSVPTPTRTSDCGARGRLWIGGAVAATILVLGTSGTLSSWTAAVLENDKNTAVTADAVILRETAGTAVCASSNDPTNSSTCTTINKYGGPATPLSPGDQKVVDVTFTNTGGADATSFELAPGLCSQTPTAGTGTPAAADVCTSGDLTVAVSCSPDTAYDADNAWTDLVYAAGAPPTTTEMHTAATGALNAGASWTCRFTVAVLSTASVLAQGVEVSQPLTWTLAG